jgi:hypothetical protein
VVGTLEIIILLVVVALAVVVSNKLAGKEDEPAQVVEPVQALDDLPFGNWAWIDECKPAKAEGDETNGAQDLMFALAYEVATRGTRPRFIGVTRSQKHGIDKQPTLEMIKALCINVPVYQGHTEYKAAKSELSDAIVAETEIRNLDLVSGGPAYDIQYALQNGTKIDNTLFFGLLRNTWNGEKHPAFIEAARMIPQLLGESRVVEVKAPDYYHMLFRANLPAEYRDTETFIHQNRKLKAWDLACSPGVIARNKQLNRSNDPKWTGGLRAGADSMALVARNGENILDAGHLFSNVQHGFDIFRDRIARGAVNTL